MRAVDLLVNSWYQKRAQKVNYHHVICKGSFSVGTKIDRVYNWSVILRMLFGGFNTPQRVTARSHRVLQGCIVPR